MASYKSLIIYAIGKKMEQYQFFSLAQHTNIYLINTSNKTIVYCWKTNHAKNSNSNQMLPKVCKKRQNHIALSHSNICSSDDMRMSTYYNFTKKTQETNIRIQGTNMQKHTSTSYTIEPISVIFSSTTRHVYPKLTNKQQNICLFVEDMPYKNGENYQMLRDEITQFFSHSTTKSNRQEMICK